MNKSTEKIISVLLTIITIFSIGINCFAISSSEAHLQIEKDYNTALSLAGYGSFHGRCNEATAYQLLAKGIYKGDIDYMGDGCLWYSDFKGVQKTSGGYNVVTIGGKNCLYELIKKYGNNLSNIVMSYGTGGSSGSSHVMLISYIIDGYVYFTDSFRYWLDAEGDTRVLSVDEFYDEYYSMNGNPYGCVYFSKTEKSNSLVSDSGSQKKEAYKIGSYEILVDDLSFRKGASRAYDVIDYINTKTYVFVTEIKDNWAKATINGVTGWFCLNMGKDYAKFVSSTDVTHKIEITGFAVEKNEKTEVLTAECTSRGGWDPVTYKFDVYKDGELLKQGVFGNKNTFTFAPETEGTFSIKVTVKDGKGTEITKTSSYFYYYASQNGLKKGDANGDGKITVSDARTVLKFVAKTGQLDGDFICGADANGDGKIGVDDARLILRLVAHL